MKKLLLLLLIFQLFCVVSFAQEKAKPTKQETMDWIAGKLKANLNKPRFFKNYSNGVFVYSRYNNSGERCDNSIDLGKVTKYSHDPNYGYGPVFMRGNNLLSTTCYKGEKISDSNTSNAVSITGERSSTNEACTDEDDCEPSIFEIDFEEGLWGRFEKALDTLINFNTRTENEPF